MTRGVTADSPDPCPDSTQSLPEPSVKDGRNMVNTPYVDIYKKSACSLYRLCVVGINGKQRRVTIDNTDIRTPDCAAEPM